MIWGYHHFWKHPYSIVTNFPKNVFLFATRLTCYTGVSHVFSGKNSIDWKLNPDFQSVKKQTKRSFHPWLNRFVKLRNQGVFVCCSFTNSKLRTPKRKKSGKSDRNTKTYWNGNKNLKSDSIYRHIHQPGNLEEFLDITVSPYSVVHPNMLEWCHPSWQ